MTTVDASEVGRLDRILAEQAASPEAVPPEAERRCFIGDGCLGQHLLDQHTAIEEIVGESLNAAQIESIVAAVTLPLETYRAVAVALENECAALTDALAAATHTLDPSINDGVFGCHVCGVEHEAFLAASVHRTPAVVRAELEER